MPAEDPQPKRRRGRPPTSPVEEDPEPRKSRKRGTSIDRIPQGKKQKTTNETSTKRMALVSFPIDSRSSRPRSPSPDFQLCTCDGCTWQNFTGIRYKCSVCDDYDLCSQCYNRNIHDLFHPFIQITKMHDQPIFLPARRKPSTNTVTLPPPISAPGPFFYNTMSTADLKTFLTEHGVESDVLDKETLCRHAWDTYCDCMAFDELNTFLSDRRISTVGCRDVNSRRQMAKDAFELPTARRSRPPASSDTSALQFRKDDIVILTGLNQAGGWMNGKTATVISEPDSEGKVLVRATVVQKFKVKLENLKMKDDGEVVEELL